MWRRSGVIPALALLVAAPVSAEPQGYASAAYIAYVEGEAAQRAGEDWTRARAGTVLEAGDGLVTGLDGRLEIGLHARAFVRLAGHGALALAGGTGEDPVFDLLSGTAALDWRAPAALRTVTFNTPYGRISARNPGYYRVALLDDDRVETIVRAGARAEVRHRDGRSVALSGDRRLFMSPAGFGTNVRAGAADAWDEWNRARTDAAIAALAAPIPAAPAARADPAPDAEPSVVWRRDRYLYPGDGWGRAPAWVDPHPGYAFLHRSVPYYGHAYAPYDGHAYAPYYGYPWPALVPRFYGPHDHHGHDRHQRHRHGRHAPAAADRGRRPAPAAGAGLPGGAAAVQPIPGGRVITGSPARAIAVEPGTRQTIGRMRAVPPSPARGAIATPRGAIAQPRSSLSVQVPRGAAALLPAPGGARAVLGGTRCPPHLDCR